MFDYVRNRKKSHRSSASYYSISPLSLWLALAFYQIPRRKYTLSCKHEQGLKFIPFWIGGYVKICFGLFHRRRQSRIACQTLESLWKSNWNLVSASFPFSVDPFLNHGSDTKIFFPKCAFFFLTHACHLKRLHCCRPSVATLIAYHNSLANLFSMVPRNLPTH